MANTEFTNIQSISSQAAKTQAAIEKILNHLPRSWVELTTHRLDVYDESQAKSQFLTELQKLVASNGISQDALENLPTAYDYIRLGHQLSSVLEWGLGEINGLKAEQAITFSSKTMPILAVLRKAKLENKTTHIYYQTSTSPLRDIERLKSIYGYNFSQTAIKHVSEIPQKEIENGSENDFTLLITQSPFEHAVKATSAVDVTVNLHPHFGCVALVHNQQIDHLVSDIQHVRRRESIAMTPVNALSVLQTMVGLAHSVNNSTNTSVNNHKDNLNAEKIAEAKQIIDSSIQKNTGSQLTPLIASSGLSIQYAIMMGLVEDALVNHPNKAIHVLLPPNCYGGTNDQARRIADVIPQVEIVDLLVDGGKDMVSSLQQALGQSAKADAAAIVLAEIPTNPRVEVPDMEALGLVLSEIRTTPSGSKAIAPVFMVDQTFCPHVNLLQDSSQLALVKTISFSSGSKFPSGGRCIAGYCAANQIGGYLLNAIEKHLDLSDNAAIDHQMITLSETMPSMQKRIKQAYFNTRGFVQKIQSLLPNAKINFVSDELAEQGFTPSVFSLDLPTQGNTDAEKEDYKRQLNLKLINHMISDSQNHCKYCVSYGQLRGTYWTIPATSTQGTTKESDKDYIVRVALSPESDVERLSTQFEAFCQNENLLTDNPSY
jgi:cystathionine beta-lyase/cystathionine gamma-synthase